MWLFIFVVGQWQEKAAERRRRLSELQRGKAAGSEAYSAAAPDGALSELEQRKKKLQALHDAFDSPSQSDRPASTLQPSAPVTQAPHGTSHTLAPSKSGRRIVQRTSISDTSKPTGYSTVARPHTPLAAIMAGAGITVDVTPPVSGATDRDGTRITPSMLPTISTPQHHGKGGGGGGAAAGAVGPSGLVMAHGGVMSPAAAGGSKSKLNDVRAALHAGDGSPYSPSHQQVGHVGGSPSSKLTGPPISTPRLDKRTHLGGYSMAG